MTDPALVLLGQQPHLAQLTADFFGFDLRAAEHGERVRLASHASLVPVAGDGTGGTYFVCGGGPVLYASPDRRAGLIGDSVTEVLEVLVGLPRWQDVTTGLLAPEEEVLRDTPDMAEHRKQLRAALGLSERTPAELIGRLRVVLSRTEPDHLLLDADEGQAYALLDRRGRPPLWESVLAPGLTDLRLMRSDPAARHEVASDAARRATALRAAQFDRGDDDLPLLRVLLRHEAADTGMSEELRLAAVLVGRYGLAEDLALLHEARETDQSTQDGLFELPHQPARVARWARALDDTRYGEDAADMPPYFWIRLACRQGRPELARTALIRALDDAGPDAALLERLRQELELMGDLFQAARAQRGLVALLDTPWERASGFHTLARLERTAGILPAAWTALRRTLSELKKDNRSVNWRRLGLGGSVAEEHLLLAAAAARSDRPGLAHDAMASAQELLGQLPERTRRALAELAEETSLLIGPGPAGAH